jgi:PAS domain S-box-containing protein
MGMLRHIIRNLEIIYSINQAVHQSFDLDEVFKVALDMTLSLDNVDMGFIYLVDFGRTEAVLQAHRNVPEDYIKRAGRIPYPKGITWKIIDSGKAVNIKDIQKDPHVGPAGRELGHHGVLGIPITAEGKVIGVIYFATYKEREFRAEEVELLSSIGRQIAISAAKAKLYRELSKRNQYQTIISTVTQAVHQSINLIEVLENATQSMIENIDRADSITIYLIEGNEAVLKAHRGLTDQYIKQAGRILFPKGATWKAIIEGTAIYCGDVELDKVIGPAGKKMGTKSYLCTPIRFDGTPVGSLNITSFSKNAFDQEELKLLSIVAQQIEVAIHNAKQAEVLRESEERCRTLIEHTYGVICEASIEGRFLYISPTDKILGYQPRDLLGKSIFDNIHPEDHSAAIKEFQKAVRDFSSESVVFRYQHKNGNWHWIESTGKPFKTASDEVRVIIASRDITERKHNEERLKNSHERLQALATHLQSVREEERTRIAREIHDELGQTLTGMQMSLSWLDKKLSKLDDSKFTSQPIIREEIVNISRLVDNAIQTVQEITTELRPVLLDDLGIRAAIEWQAQEFQTRTGIACTSTSNVENITLAQQLSTAIFRILQEALTNVVRHANATRVEIVFIENEAHLELDVIDNGKGIKEHEIESSKSLGLLGMRERVLPFGGTVKIAGIPRTGTRLTVQIPLKG